MKVGGSADPHNDATVLLASAREGNEEAWRTLVEQLYPMIIAIVRKHLRRAADHDDVVQEVLLKAFLKLDSYAGVQPIEHWISRITVTTCIDWLRKLKARPSVTWSDLSEREQSLLDRRNESAADEVESEDTRLAMRALLDKLIAALKPNQQVVVRLLDLELHSVKEVAELTGWGESKVKVTAMRARKKLGELLQNLEISK
jgi:RNA polymerase sigma factor (sigma-70 family)